MPCQSVLTLCFLATVNAQGSPTYRGHDRQLRVSLLRDSADVTIDGKIDEAVWQKAALLTGFSQFSPKDGIPAQDSTQVLVWYSPTAMYFGIRAFEAHGVAQATLGQRDHVMDVDDNVQLYLGTFNDARQAILLAVNPLGVQVDGTVRESYQRPAAGWWERPTTRQPPDLSQDFVFESKGRLTPWGYEVEVRVPFRSLPYQRGSPQSWGFNVVRQVQHSGYEDSWAPARRASVSFLAQSGTLEGLSEIRRGLVLELNPVVTQQTLGGRDGDATSAWSYDAERPSLSGNVKWGIASNATINATINPDFSQIESDAGQLITDPRKALFFPEKRPFFLDNLDAFSVPNNLIYTRAIRRPRVATKLTGTLPRTSLAFLFAADSREASRETDLGRERATPFFNILRAQRDVGALSRVGVTLVDTRDGASSNSVGEIDGAFALGRSSAVALQLAGSRTRDSASAVGAPMWSVELNRQNIPFGFNYSLTGMDPDFHARTAFVLRPGIVAGQFSHHLTYLARRGRLFEAVSFDPTLVTNWKYREFTRGEAALERKLQLITRYQLRGGWTASAALLLETFGYDPDLFRGVYVERRTSSSVDTVPFTGGGRLPNRDYVLSVNSPQWSWLNFSEVLLWGQDENFDEWSSGGVIYSTFAALIRPTDRLRFAPTFDYLLVTRKSTGETVKIQRVARLKTEYQLTRALFVRFTGEFDGFDRLPLRDDTRTEGSLLFRNSDGTFTRSERTLSRQFRADWLVALQPGPGTVFFAGYGSTMDAPTSGIPNLFSSRYRQADAFFVKGSYVFRR